MSDTPPAPMPEPQPNPEPSPRPRLFESYDPLFSPGEEYGRSMPEKLSDQ